MKTAEIVSTPREDSIPRRTPVSDRIAQQIIHAVKDAQERRRASEPFNPIRGLTKVGR